MKIVVVMSGGVDSTTLLYRLKHEGHEVLAMSFYYGQKHGRKELGASQDTCKSLGVFQRIVNLDSLQGLISNSALTGNIPVPEGRYDAEVMKLTVVPGRNLMMASIALAYAENIGAEGIAMGMHKGDHHIYPDCRPSFVAALRVVAQHSTGGRVEVLTPYLRFSKAEIVKDGIRLKVDYSKTWSCYVGGAVSYTHLRAHETVLDLVCRLLLEKKKNK